MPPTATEPWSAVLVTTTSADVWTVVGWMTVLLAGLGSGLAEASAVVLLSTVPAGTFKIKVLYEEGIAGLQLPAIAWVLRRRLLGTNVGRWDYLGSLIEMWKDDPKGAFPDPQTIGMATPNMIAYQRYNALAMIMAGLKNGELETAAAFVHRIPDTGRTRAATSEGGTGRSAGRPGR